MRRFNDIKILRNRNAKRYYINTILPDIPLSSDDLYGPDPEGLYGDPKNKTEEVDPKTNNLDLRYIDVTNPHPEKSVEGKILDELKLHKYCCRRMMLGNVHIISYLS